MKYKILTPLILFILLLSSLVSATVLTINEVDLVNSDLQFNGKKTWLVNIVIDGNVDFVSGTTETFDNNLIQDGGSTAQNDLTVKVEGIEKKCNYPIDMGFSEPVFNYEITDSGANWLGIGLQDDVDDCRSQPNYEWDLISNTHVYCILRNIQAVVGQVQTPSDSFKAEIQVNGETGVISSKDQTSVAVGTIAKANWVGSFVTGDLCPISEFNDKIVYETTTSTTRKLQREVLYNDWRNSWVSLQNLLGGISDNTKVSSTKIQEVEDAINNQNSFANTFTSSSTFVSGFSFTSDGQGEIEGLDVTRPYINLHIDAERLGLVTPVGVPNILSTSCLDFSELTEGEILVLIENKGNNLGSFSASAICDSPLIQKGNAVSVPPLQPGEKTTIKIPIIVDVQTDTIIKRSCVVEVIDINDATNKDTSSTSCQVSNTLVCTPGAERCQNGKKYICNSDGTGETIDLLDYSCLDEVAGQVCGDGVCEGDEKETCIDDCKTELKAQCESEGGVYTTTEKTKFIFFKEEVGKCIFPRVSVFAIILLILGILIIVLPFIPIPPMAKAWIGGIMIGIGIIWLLLGLGGLLPPLN